jgi:hypothetical protein
VFSATRSHSSVASLISKDDRHDGFYRPLQLFDTARPWDTVPPLAFHSSFWCLLEGCSQLQNLQL